MRVRECYNRMISFIENAVTEQYSFEDVFQGLQKIYFGGDQELGHIFKFMTGMTLRGYFSERQMMHAYKALARNQDMEQAMKYSGLGNQSSFARKFKEKFRITATEAQQETALPRYHQALTWEALSQDGASPDTRTIKEAEMEMPAISFADYALLQEASSLQSVYGFSNTWTLRILSEFVKYDLSLERMFELVYRCKMEYDWLVEDGIYEAEKDDPLLWAKVDGVIRLSSLIDCDSFDDCLFILVDTKDPFFEKELTPEEVYRYSLYVDYYGVYLDHNRDYEHFSKAIDYYRAYRHEYDTVEDEDGFFDLYLKAAAENPCFSFAFTEALDAYGDGLLEKDIDFDLEDDDSDSFEDPEASFPGREYFETDSGFDTYEDYDDMD